MQSPRFLAPWESPRVHHGGLAEINKVQTDRHIQAYKVVFADIEACGTADNTFKSF